MYEQLIQWIQENKTPILLFVQVERQDEGILRVVPTMLEQLTKIEGWKISHTRSSVIDVNNGTQEYEIIVTTEKGITLRSKDKEHHVFHS